MAFQPGANLYSQGFGSVPENVEVPHYDVRAPASTDVNYPLGKRWIFVGTGEYVLLSQSSVGGVLSSNWSLLGTTGGALNTLTTDDTTVVIPAAGNINLAGASPLSTTGAGSTATINLGTVPVSKGGTGLTSITAHDLVVGNGTSALTLLAPSATAGVAVVSQGAAADPHYGTVVVAGGGTGAVTLTGVLTGNGTSAVTANAVTNHGVLLGGASNAVSSLGVAASGTILAGITGADPSFTATPSGLTSLSAGTLTAGTNITSTAGTITATLGNIIATNGNVELNTAGNKIIIATGANASVGTSAAMSGTPGAVTVATTASSATAKIFYSRATTGGTPGEVSITAQDGTGFTLTSTANETSTFNWWIINA